MIRLLTFPLFLKVLLFALVASAQPSDHEAKRAAYREGYAAVRAENWPTAYDIFVRLWKEERRFDVALNLGQAEFQLGKYRDAAEHLAFAAARIPLGEKPERAERIAEALRIVKEKVGSLTITVDRPGATIAIDGEPVGTAPIAEELFVDPGVRVIEASLEGYQGAKRELEVVAGKTYDIALALEPKTEAQGPATSAAAVPPPASPPTRSSAPVAAAEPTGRTIALIGGLTLTGAAAIATTVFALDASSSGARAEDLQRDARKQGSDACAKPGGVLADTCASLHRANRDRSTANKRANVALVFTGIFAVATATAFFAWPDGTESARSSGARVLPAVDTTSIGLVVSGEL